MRKVIHISTLLFCLLSVHVQAQVRISLPKGRSLRTEPDTISVTIIGDVMMHSRQLEYSWNPFLKEIAPHLRNADIAIANMEYTLAGEPYSGYPSFSAPDGYTRYLADSCGTDVLLLANNHILDKGPHGLGRTLEVLDGLEDELGVQYTGAAANQNRKDNTYPLMISRKGIRLAFINFTYGTNTGPDGNWPKVNRMQKEDVRQAIERAKEKGADFIIALPHWGEEYSLKHNARQEEWAGWMASQGVSAIVGSHPHVVQDSTVINGVPVFYSLGNAVSNMSLTNTRLGLAVTLKFTVDFSGTSKQMLEPQVDYLWCALPGMLIDNYCSIFIKEWATRKSEWLIPDDFNNMMSTYDRVRKATGLED